MAVASAGPYANLHLAPDNLANIPPLSFLQAAAELYWRDHQRVEKETENTCSSG